MSNPLIHKLEQFERLSEDERQALRDAVIRVEDIGPRQDIIREKQRPDDVHLLIEGWAARYKVLPDGERQIMAFLIPGDLCDVHIALLRRMDHSIGTLSQCRVGFIPVEKINQFMRENQRLSRALFWATLVDEAILREWLTNIGRRSAEKRIAHLICEMLLRSKAVGITADNSFEMAVTQQELADTLGLTAVSVNRVLQQLRRDGLISTQGRRVSVDDFDRLAEFADFDALYLHQESKNQEGRAD